MILPLESLNSFGVYGTLTPTTNLPDDLMFSGTVLAMSSTLAAAAAVVAVAGPAVSLFLVQPDKTSAPDTAMTAAPRHQRELTRRSWIPASTLSLLSASGRLHFVTGDDVKNEH